jgi:hypothetical protein
MLVIYSAMNATLRALPLLAVAALATPPADAAPGAVDTPVYRCAARGRVTYQELPCPAGTRSVVVYIHGDTPGAPRDDLGRGAASSASIAPSKAPGLRDALARIRVGMTAHDFEALDPRLRTGTTRRLEANGHRHEWRYVADDCVVHLADGVVVAVYR